MTVVQREARCFIVEEHQTSPYREPPLHFDTRREAEEAIGDLGVDAHVGQWPAPCWLAKCDDCDTVLGSDDFDEAHYDTQDEAARHADALDDPCADEVCDCTPLRCRGDQCGLCAGRPDELPCPGGPPFGG